MCKDSNSFREKDHRISQLMFELWFWSYIEAMLVDK